MLPSSSVERARAVTGQDSADLRNRSARGFAWNVFAVVASQPVTLLTTIALGRLLTPADFGLAAMAGLFVGLASVVNDFGLVTAVIQRPELTDDEVQSAFWFNLCLGWVMLLAGVLVALPLAAFFEQPEITWLVPVSSIAFVISSFTLIPTALFSRRMEFRCPAVGKLVTAGATLGASVVLAVMGAGVWAIVVGSLVGSSVGAVYLLRSSGWRPRVHFSWQEVRPLVRFGGIMTGAALVSYLSWNVDYLVVGRVLGTTPLGAYTLAFNFTSVPTRKISGTLATSSLPAFARVQDQLARFRSGYLDALSLSALPAAALLATAAVLSEELVIGLYGEQWSAAITPLRVLCGAGFVTAVTTLIGLVFKGLGRPESELRWNVVLLSGTTGGVLVGVRYGLDAAAAGVLFGMLITRLPAQVAANRLIGVSTSEFIRSLLPALVAGAAAGALAWAARQALISLGVPPLLRLLIAGSVALAGAWLLVRWSGLRDPLRATERAIGKLYRGWRDKQVTAGRGPH